MKAVVKAIQAAKRKVGIKTPQIYPEKQFNTTPPIETVESTENKLAALYAEKQNLQESGAEQSDIDKIDTEVKKLGGISIPLKEAYLKGGPTQQKAMKKAEQNRIEALKMKTEKSEEMKSMLTSFTQLFPGTLTPRTLSQLTPNSPKFTQMNLNKMRKLVDNAARIQGFLTQEQLTAYNNLLAEIDKS